MEETNVKDLLKFFVSKIYILIIIMSIFAIGGFVYSKFIQTPLYKSTSTVILVSEQKEKTNVNDINLNKQLVSTYSEMIKNSGVDILPQEKCSCLSGGMLQKLMFERELYGSPEFLILCNPLQGLDTATCTRTCGRIKEAAQKGAYVLILSYGAFPSGFCDIQYKLSNGKLEGV